MQLPSDFRERSRLTLTFPDTGPLEIILGEDRKRRAVAVNGSDDTDFSEVAAALGSAARGFLDFIETVESPENQNLLYRIFIHEVIPGIQVIGSDIQSDDEPF